MVVSGHDYDWSKQVKEFEETKAGVKGLVDAGVAKLPELFVHPRDTLESNPVAEGAQLELPTIDFGAKRCEVVEKIREAAQHWGFFRIVNHGIPLETMDAMLEASRRFHELPCEEKMPYYSVDRRRRVKFNSNLPVREYDPACWRDILSCVFLDDQLDSQLIPSACRKEMQEYVEQMIKVRELMAELVSEALGLRSDHLSKMECMKSQALALNYYPTCPEPHKTLGTSKHSDTTFLTLLMQDNNGGLQILHHHQWIDVPPLRGALLANIGDLMQIISNDKFISVEHRVVAQTEGSRISVASFFSPSSSAAATPFAPIQDLLSHHNPPIYKEFMFGHYCELYKTRFHGATSALSHFKI